MNSLWFKSSKDTTDTPLDLGRRINEQFVSAFLCLVTSSVLIGVILYRCQFGLDLTDEGFYLTWISRPELYRSSATQFGFFFKPLYEVLGYDLVLLRQTNVITALILAFAAFWLLLHPATFSKIARAILALALSSSALLVLHHMWLPTPSYNWLNLYGLLISLIGCLLSLRVETVRGELSGGALIGLGGVVVALAKPTSAIALAVLLLCVFAWELRTRPRHALTTAVTATVVAIGGGLLAAWLIDHSPIEFVERLTRGAELGYTLGSHRDSSLMTEYQIFRWDRFPAPRHFFLQAFVVAVVSAIYAIYCRDDTVTAQVIRTSILILISLTAIVSLTWPGAIGLLPKQIHVYQILAVLSGTLFVSLILARSGNKTTLTSPVFVILFFLPFIHAIGTTNNLWLQASQALLFWIGAAVVVVNACLEGEHRSRVISSLSLATAAASSILVSNSMEKPYRQTMPIRTQNVGVAIDVRSQRLVYVSPDTADFIAGLRAAASQGQIRRILDVSGRHPAAAYLANAEAPGAPWLLGGYTNSVGFFHAVMMDVSCEEIAESWILSAPLGTKQSLPPAVLKTYGLDLDRDFQLVRKLSSPWYGTQLSLWRPVRPVEGAQVCRSARSAH